MPPNSDAARGYHPAARVGQSDIDGVEQSQACRSGRPYTPAKIERRHDDLGGIAVHIAARVAALANEGEILVSRTVRNLVVESGLGFEDRCAHELKGVPEHWQIYAAC